MFLLQSPPKGATIPYRPKPQMNGPVIVANGQAYTIQGNYAVPAQETCTVFPLAIAGGLHAAGISGLADPLLKGTHLQGAIPPHHLQPIPDVGGLAKNPLAGLAALGLAGAIPTNTGGLNPTALAALAGSQLRTNNNRSVTTQVQSQSHEMTVPNDLIGCIIGKGGTKIAEIRQISGAMIRISNCEERDSGNTDRTITITGNPDSVALAQYLINMSVELQKANLGDEAGATGPPSTASGVNPLLPNTSSSSGSGSSGAGSNSAAASAIASNPLASAIPLAQLLSKPGALNALTSLSALGGLSDLLGGLSSGAAGVGLGSIQTTGVSRPKTTRMRSPNSNTSMNGDSNKKSERNKFNPY
nr:poly(rC)-binding protein 2-like isoform X3 [Aedes albopictus]